MVRQYVWQEEYPSHLIPSLLKHNSPRVARDHVDHCIETLREALMCNADLTPYLWYDNSATGQPAKEDFEASHKCVRWDPLVEWVRNHGVKIPHRAFVGHGHHHEVPTV